MAHGPWTHRTLFQLSIIGSESNVQLVNVHNFEATVVNEATFTSDDVAIVAQQTLITAWLAAGKTTYLAAHDSTYRLNNVRCQVLERPGNVNHKLSPTENTQTSGNAGVQPGGSEDMTSSANIKWRSSRAGKQYRGRSYVGPVPSTYISQGAFENTGLATYQAYADAMISTFGALAGSNLAFRLTIYSRPYNHLEYGYATGHNPSRTWYYPPDYDGDSTNVIAGTVDPTIRTQRRRQLGVGS